MHRRQVEGVRRSRRIVPSVIPPGNAAPETAPLVPGLLAGAVRLERRIGAGSTGEVWLARLLEPRDWARSGDLVVAKFLRGRDPEANRREAAIAAAVVHPGIVRGLELGRAHLDGREIEYLPELMERVFAADVLECPRCRGRRKLIAVITDPAVLSFCTTFYRR